MSGWGPICGAVIGASVVIALAIGSLTDAVRMVAWALRDIEADFKNERKPRT